jgi:hypothetical protein
MLMSGCPDRSDFFRDDGDSHYSVRLKELAKAPERRRYYNDISRIGPAPVVNWEGM